jgi:purine nucleoside permease
VLSQGVRTLFLFSLLVLSASAELLATPTPIKVVVIATFEIGADSGDVPGELQNWVEREHLTNPIKVPGMDHAVYVTQSGLMVVVSGATSRCAIQIQSLVLDPRFDFTRAYWMLAGIAGVDPAEASIGSAAWARYVVDGDDAYEVDPREVSGDWPYGILVLGADRPNVKPPPQGWEPAKMSYELNPALVARAYSLTKDVKLEDTPQMKAYRGAYIGFPNAQKPPFVLLGDVLGCNRYWHGEHLTHWARDWVKLMTDGKGEFAMSAMEDQGVALALHSLAQQQKVDFRRVLFLRTASNYCMQSPKQGVIDSLKGNSGAFLPSLDAAYSVGSAVVHDILNNWDDVYAKGVDSP